MRLFQRPVSSPIFSSAVCNTTCATLSCWGIDCLLCQSASAIVPLGHFHLSQGHLEDRPPTP
jgi:hypothetical protein